MLAPKFNLVAKPNDWSKTVREIATASGQLTEVARLRVEFWGAFSECMKAEGSTLRPAPAKPYNWQGWGIGRSYFQLCAGLNVRDQRHRVYLNLSGPDAEAHYQLLQEQRAEIERAIGPGLEWEIPASPVCGASS